MYQDSLVNDINAQQAYQASLSEEMVAIRIANSKIIDNIMGEIRKAIKQKQRGISLNYPIPFDVRRYLDFLGYKVESYNYFPSTVNWDIKK